jgi:hypothetical protein
MHARTGGEPFDLTPARARHCCLSAGVKPPTNPMKILARVATYAWRAGAIADSLSCRKPTEANHTLQTETPVRCSGSLGRTPQKKS